MATIHATINVAITHKSGPVIDDPVHVLNWIAADSQSYGGGGGGFSFNVCPHHSDPDLCDCCGDDATYVARPHAAKLD
jgi:hypothetical protein